MTGSNGSQKRGMMRHGGSKTPSFVFVGLLVVIAILGVNYWTLSTSNEEQKERIVSLRRQLEEIKKNYDAIDEIKSKLEVEFQRKEKGQNELLSQKEKDQDTLEEQVEQMSKNMKEIKAECDQNISDLHACQDTVASEEKKNEECSMSRDRAHTEIDEYRALNAKLENELRDLHTQIREGQQQHRPDTWARPLPQELLHGTSQPPHQQPEQPLLPTQQQQQQNELPEQRGNTVSWQEEEKREETGSQDQYERALGGDRYRDTGAVGHVPLIEQPATKQVTADSAQGNVEGRRGEVLEAPVLQPADTNSTAREISELVNRIGEGGGGVQGGVGGVYGGVGGVYGGVGGIQGAVGGVQGAVGGVHGGEGGVHGGEGGVQGAVGGVHGGEGGVHGGEGGVHGGEGGVKDESPPVTEAIEKRGGEEEVRQVVAPNLNEDTEVDKLVHRAAAGGDGGGVERGENADETEADEKDEAVDWESDEDRMKFEQSKQLQPPMKAGDRLHINLDDPDEYEEGYNNKMANEMGGVLDVDVMKGGNEIQGDT